MNKWNLSTLKNLLELSICQTIIGLIFSRLHKSMLLQHHLLPHSLKHSPLSSDVQKKNTKAFYLSFTLSCIVLRYAIWNSKKSKKTEIIQIPMSVRSTFGAQLAKFVQSHSSITKSKYVLFLWFIIIIPCFLTLHILQSQYHFHLVVWFYAI